MKISNFVSISNENKDFWPEYAIVGAICCDLKIVMNKLMQINEVSVSSTIQQCHFYILKWRTEEKKVL